MHILYRYRHVYLRRRKIPHSLNARRDGSFGGALRLSGRHGDYGDIGGLFG